MSTQRIWLLRVERRTAVTPLRRLVTRGWGLTHAGESSGMTDSALESVRADVVNAAELVFLSPHEGLGCLFFSQLRGLPVEGGMSCAGGVTVVRVGAGVASRFTRRWRMLSRSGLAGEGQAGVSRAVRGVKM